MSRRHLGARQGRESNMSIPAGWAVHPQDPAWMYELANSSNVQQVPVPVAAVYVPPQPVATPQYGQADSSLVDGEIQGLNTFGKSDIIWLDFPKLERTGDEATMTLRFLPPWSYNERLPYFTGNRHSLPTGVLPETKSKWPSVDCYNNKGGPGSCDVCTVIEELISSGQLQEDDTKKCRRCSAKSRMRWQALNIADPNAHWTQKKDDAGNVLTDAAGQPQWQLTPGIFTAGPDLQKKILTIWKTLGDPTNPDTGYSMNLIKRKTGPEDMNVEYDAVGMHKEPIDEGMRSVLENLVDLPKLMYFRDRAVMQTVAMNLRSKFRLQPTHGYAAPPAQPAYAPPPVAAAPPAPPMSPPTAWLSHPGDPRYEYNPQNNQVRLKAAAAPPAPPVAPSGPPALPSGPPRLPSPPVGAVGAPAGPPSLAARPPHLPPPTAPGMVGGRPVGPVMAPPPPPGMPAAISPAQLERQLAAGRTDDGTPF